MDYQNELNKCLKNVVTFSPGELTLILEHCAFRNVRKHDTLLGAGQVCSSLFFLLKGACYQFRIVGTNEKIIDLHVDHECVLNPASFISQQPSGETIKAFENSDLLALTLQSLHRLIAMSPAFLQLAKLLQWPSFRVNFLDNAMTPAEKYRYILGNKPQLIRKFPLKYIASYLNITPETLSRVRASV